MGYTAYNVMREKNKKRWGIDGPIEPKMFEKIRLWKKDENGRRRESPSFDDISDLERKAILFIREDCENLRFDYSEKHKNLDDLDGTSLKKGQIPHNFQMDIDRRCLEVAIHRFLESGVAKDAFDVYFCYLEMFVGSYRKTKKMIEMLSEFEANASSLLMKHRDHYSHSVYVFLIGLAFYHESDSFRNAYKNAYGSLLEKEGLDQNNKQDLAAHFLKFWGMSSLFHDVGYPFELAFEQVKSYFGDTIDYVPFATFNMNNFQNSKVTEIKEKAVAIKQSCAVKYAKLASDEDATFDQEEKELEKIEKKVAGLVKTVFGETSEEYKNRIQLTGDDKKEIAPAKLYQGAIVYLDKFMADIDKVKQTGINKLKKLALGSESNEGLENFNAFLANALYEELGEAYAYYGEDKAKKFDVFEEYTKSQDNQFAYKYQDYLFDVLNVKPEHPEAFGGFIDHAYFGTIILLNTLIQVVEEKSLNEMYTHALTAILLHNSLYKFSITNYKNGAFNDGKHFSLQKHPLAYLLMLCDELQCWDRTSYGQSSRGEIHPFECELQFYGNEIIAIYIFDEKYSENDKLKPEYESVKGTYKKLCEKGDKPSDFLDDIQNIISINGDTSFGEANGISLKVGKKFKENSRYRNSQLSTSNFIHMYKFAVLVHKMNHLEEGQLLDKSQMTEMEDVFEELSLEYKINHISRTKKFSKVLSKVGCFYSDKPMDCEVVTEFGDELNETMGPIEHERWCWEHWVTGWRYIPKDELESVKKKYPEAANIIRECTKRHPDLFEVDEDKYEKQAGLEHFHELDEKNGHDKDSKEKDTRSICNLLKVLAREDGVKVYRLREDK